MIWDNSNYNNYHGGGDFPHTYVIMHKCFGKKNKNAKNKYISFKIQVNMFSFMKISCTFCQHSRRQILSLMNIINQPNGEKISISLLPFRNGFYNLQNSYIVYYLVNCIIWTLSNINVYITYPWKKIEVNGIV